ncbi:MAG: NYN domain-containing protein, partial [Promethearchaeota archaeon]
TLPYYTQSIRPLGKNDKTPKNNSEKSQIKILKTKVQEREKLLEIIAKRLQKLSSKNSNVESQKKNTKLTCKTFILDGSNIARHNQSSEKGSIQDVIGSKKVLLDAGIPEENIFIIFGSGLHHHITDEERVLYDDLLQKRNNVQAPAGADDDWFIIQHGFKHNSYIITNDLYAEYKEKGEEYKDYIESHSIRYSIIGNDVYFEKELEML